jgi:hypothetical protein
VLQGGNRRYVSLAGVIKKLTILGEWFSATRTAHVNAVRPRAERTQTNEDSVAAAVEIEPWETVEYRTKIRKIQDKDP